MKPYKEWQMLPTRQSKEILDELIETIEAPKACLIINDTGLCKTSTVNIFLKKTPKYTYKVTVGASFKLMDVVDSILEEMGITHNFMLSEIRKKINLIAKHVKGIKEQGHNARLIIDEAENLRPSVLELIKEIYDAIIDYCSIVLIGTPQIMAVILNTRKRNRKGCPQLWRRFKAGTRYVSQLDKAKDFKAFFELYIPSEISLQNLLITLCDNYGELHDYLDPYLRYCTKANKEPCEADFRKFHKMPPLKLKAA
ncbi:MAG: ATP-binding protein [Bacteroidetes bacterium]|nr:ATP-binding protein [Bacteroidota bacterium]